jgi:hypothetical protein
MIRCRQSLVLRTFSARGAACWQLPQGARCPAAKRVLPAWQARGPPQICSPSACPCSPAEPSGIRARTQLPLHHTCKVNAVCREAPSSEQPFRSADSMVRRASVFTWELRLKIQSHMQGILGDGEGLALLQQSSLLGDSLAVCMRLVLLCAAPVFHPDELEKAEDDWQGHSDECDSALHALSGISMIIVSVGRHGMLGPLAERL